MDIVTDFALDHFSVIKLHPSLPILARHKEWRIVNLETKSVTKNIADQLPLEFWRLTEAPLIAEEYTKPQLGVDRVGVSIYDKSLDKLFGRDYILFTCYEKSLRFFTIPTGGYGLW